MFTHMYGGRTVSIRYLHKDAGVVRALARARRIVLFGTLNCALARYRKNKRCVVFQYGHTYIHQYR
jgi:hypothetical protein